MDTLSAFLGLIGLLGLIIFTIVTIMNKIKKNGKSTKKYMLIFFAMFVVGLLIPSENNTPEQTEEIKQASTEKEDKSDVDSKEKTSKETKEVDTKETTEKSDKGAIDKETDKKEPASKNESKEKEVSSTQGKKIYDSAIAVPVINGSKTEKIGEMSLIKTDSALVDEDAILDWYLNYVKETDYLYYIISYVDKEELLGVYTNKGGLIEVNTGLDKDENNVFILGDDSQATFYTVGEDNKLNKIE